MRYLLLAILLFPFFAFSADEHATDAPGQAVEADHRPPPADERMETDLAKQAAKAHADYWSIVKDNEKAGLTHFGQKDIETNPRAKKQVEAQKKYMALQREALVEFFSIPERRTQMKTQDPDSIAFNKAMVNYPWEVGETRQTPATAGIMYARKHNLEWLLALSGGENKH